MGPSWRRGQRRGTSGTRARPLFQPKPEISRLALSRVRIHQVKFQLLWSLGPNQGVEYADHKMRLAAASGHAVMSETNVDVIMEVQGGKVALTLQGPAKSWFGVNFGASATMQGIDVQSTTVNSRPHICEPPLTGPHRVRNYRG